MSSEDGTIEPGFKLTRKGLRETVNPIAEGAEVAVRLTAPVKPRLVTVIVAVSDVPAKMLGLVSWPEIR